MTKSKSIKRIRKAKSKKKNRKRIVFYQLEIVHGVAGACVTLNGYRIAGPKPWGGGRVVMNFKTTNEDLERAINP